MKRYHFTVISSTNDYAKELLETEKQVIVTSDSQTKGRGRKNRVWEGDFGSNIYLSYGINHNYAPEYQRLVLYQAVGCVAVIESLETLTKSNIFKLKYPNDVHAWDGQSFKKISGVLIEHSFHGNSCKSSIIGIGINNNQSKFSKELSEIATSLKILGFDIEISDLYDILITRISDLLKKDDKYLFETWKNRLNIVNKFVEISDSDEEWKAISMLNDGTIRVINNKFEERIINDGDTIRYKLD